MTLIGESELLPLTVNLNRGVGVDDNDGHGEAHIGGEHCLLQAPNPWLQHLSMLSNGSLFDVPVPYARIATQMIPADYSTGTRHRSAQLDSRPISSTRAVEAAATTKCGGRRVSRSGRAHGPLSKDEQRRNACVRERTRMRDMNRAFDTLRQRLPYIKQHGKRISKIEALRMTIKYIKQLKAILNDSSHNSYNNEFN